ncbi:MAG: F0F1 ATP synthase subunit B, partial [Patiriisocius sp.]
REAMIKEAREIKASMIAGAKDEAQAEASKAIAGAQATIEAEKKAAVAELKQTVASLSLDIAEKIVKSELSNKDKQLELVETMLKDANVN